MTIQFVLLLLAFICFVVAATNAFANRVNLIALGLAFWVLTYLIK